MELLQCNKRDYPDYLRFVKGIYNKYPQYKDSSTPVLKQFLYKRGAFCSRLEITPMMVKKGNKIIATCMYIISKSYEKVLQVAFFDRWICSAEDRSEVPDRRVCLVPFDKKALMFPLQYPSGHPAILPPHPQ